MLCGIIWAVCAIRMYFTFVSNYFLTFHVLVRKLVWWTQNRMVSYVRQPPHQLNTLHKELRQQYVCLWWCTDPLSYDMWPSGIKFFIRYTSAVCIHVCDELDRVLRPSAAGRFMMINLIYGKNSHRNLFLPHCLI